MIPVPEGEDEPSSEDEDTEEEDAAVAMTPCQWQKHYKNYKHFRSCASKGVSFSMVVAPMYQKGLLHNGRPPPVRVSHQ